MPNVVITTAHPQISFLRLLDAADLPPSFVADIEGLADPQRDREDQPRAGPAAGVRQPTRSSTRRYTAAPSCWPRALDDVETAFQQAVAGHPSALPFADICIPSVFDPTRWHRPASTSCRCSPSGCPPAGRGRAPPSRTGRARGPGTGRASKRSRPASPARCGTAR